MALMLSCWKEVFIPLLKGRLSDPNLKADQLSTPLQQQQWVNGRQAIHAEYVYNITPLAVDSFKVPQGLAPSV